MQKMFAPIAIGLVAAVGLAGCAVPNAHPTKHPASRTTDATANNHAISAWMRDHKTLEMQEKRKHNGLTEIRSELVVPIDWDRPDRGETRLDVAQVITGRGAANHVFVNPGGPGVHADRLAETLTEAGLVGDGPKLRNTTFIGIDPRGVAGRDPIRCDQDVVGCKPSKRLVAHASARDNAMDMEYARRLVGAKRLDYLGFSWGAYLGGVSASMFPKVAGRMVLDSGYVPASSTDQSAAFGRALDRYLEACVSGKVGPCAFSGSAQDARRQLSDLADSFDSEPVQAGTRRLDGETLLFLVIQMLYLPADKWPLLSELLAPLAKRDGDGFVAAAKASNIPIAGGSSVLLRLPDAEESEPGDLMNAVRCAEPKAPKSKEKMDPLIKITDPACDRGKIAHPDPHIKADLAGPILVIGVTGDPATPYAGSVELARRIDKARLLTVEGEGHAVAMSHGIACVDDTVVKYLTTGQLADRPGTCKGAKP